MAGRVHRNSKSLKDVRIWQMDWDVRKTIFMDKVLSTFRHTSDTANWGKGKNRNEKREKRWRNRKLVRQTNRAGLRKAGYRQHPSETSTAANTNGVGLHSLTCKKMQESLGFNVAHLWSKLCKLLLKCGSLQTGCDIHRKSRVEGVPGILINRRLEEQTRLLSCFLPYMAIDSVGRWATVHGVQKRNPNPSWSLESN